MSGSTRKKSARAVKMRAVCVSIYEVERSANKVQKRQARRIDEYEKTLTASPLEVSSRISSVISAATKRTEAESSIFLFLIKVFSPVLD